MKNSRIGIFGGTFNPIHLGHIHTVSQSAKLLGLEKVALMPANIPPLKEAPTISTKHRVNMLKLVCEEHPCFYLETYELEQGETSYTVKTLQAFKDKQRELDIFFFIGMDSLVNFHLWKNYKKILELTNLVVTTRPGYDLSNVQTDLQNELIDAGQFLNDRQSKSCGNIILMPPQSFDIASSTIREMVAKHQDISSLVPECVEQYIKSHNLYR